MIYLLNMPSANGNIMTNKTLTAFYERMKTNSDNHKPHRFRRGNDVLGADKENTKLSSEEIRARAAHKRVISQARKRRGRGYSDPGLFNKTFALSYSDVGEKMSIHGRSGVWVEV